jgi:sec-independent protein translocase protein TatC
MARLGPVDHEDRLTLVEHLDELRTRLIVSLAGLVVAIALCLWQNDLLLDLAKHPIPEQHREFLTFGPTEPFMTTITIAGYGAIVLALPLILYQLYAYVLPALTSAERRVILPLLLLVPFLFAGGIVFAYLVVVPAALDFLLNFNSEEFNVELRARDYLSFFAMTLVALGFLFQMPLVILGVTRLGIVTPEQLGANRRYAVLVIAVVAMLLPGTDPVTMLISMAPLLLLFEGSLLLARFLGRPVDEGAEAAPPGEPTPERPG